MGAGVVACFHRIAGLGERLAGWGEHHRAHGDLAALGGGAGFLQGGEHGVHAGVLPAPGRKV